MEAANALHLDVDLRPRSRESFFQDRVVEIEAASGFGTALDPAQAAASRVPPR